MSSSRLMWLRRWQSTNTDRIQRGIILLRKLIRLLYSREVGTSSYHFCQRNRLHAFMKLAGQKFIDLAWLKYYVSREVSVKDEPNWYSRVVVELNHSLPWTSSNGSTFTLCKIKKKSNWTHKYQTEWKRSISQQAHSKTRTDHSTNVSSTSRAIRSILYRGRYTKAETTDLFRHKPLSGRPNLAKILQNGHRALL